MTEQVTKQPTKPTYEELAQAVLLFYFDDPQAVWHETVEALNDCGERLDTGVSDTITWDGRRGKYLNECGFNAFEFGRHPDGCIDIATSDQDVVCKVTVEQGKQISHYLTGLEERVQAHIELHYLDK